MFSYFFFKEQPYTLEKDSFALTENVQYLMLIPPTSHIKNALIFLLYKASQVVHACGPRNWRKVETGTSGVPGHL